MSSFDENLQDVQTFCDARGIPVPAEQQRLAAALATIVWESVTAWPDVIVARTGFVEHIARHLPASSEDLMISAIEELHGPDLYLAYACASGSERGLEHFYGRYLSRVSELLEHLKQSPAFADEVRQLLVERLLMPPHGAAPKIATYSGKGTLEGWLRTAARRTALNVLGDEGKSKPIEEDLLQRLLSASIDPDAELVKKQFRESLEAALRAQLRKLSNRDREVLSLHLRGLGYPKIAAIYGVDRTLPCHWLKRILRSLRAGLRHAFPSGMSASEVQWIVRVVRRQIDASLSALPDIAEGHSQNTTQV